MRLVAYLLAISLALAVARPTHARADRLANVRVGIIPIAAVLPLFTALDKGFFEEEGIKVEAIPMAGGAVILPAMACGSIDIGFTAIPSVIIARDSGFDFQIITHNNTNNTVPERNRFGYRGSEAILVLKGSKIAAAKDLEGKRVAINTLNNIAWLMAHAWMEKNGWGRPCSRGRWMPSMLPSPSPPS